MPNRPHSTSAKPRIRRFESEAQTIDATNGNTFVHGFARSPASVQVTLVCVTANNGYVVGEQIPIELVYQSAGANADGAPNWSYRWNEQRVIVIVPAGTVAIITSAGAVGGTFTPANWNVKVVCLDAFPIGEPT